MKDKDTSHPNYVGQRIRQLRKSKGVTQDYVSELAGITSGYLGQIEICEVRRLRRSALWPRSPTL